MAKTASNSAACMTCGHRTAKKSKAGKRKFCSRTCFASRRRPPGKVETRKARGPWSTRIRVSA